MKILINKCHGRHTHTHERGLSMQLRGIAKRFEELMGLWDHADEIGDDQAMRDVNTCYGAEVRALSEQLEKAGYFNEVKP